MVGALNLQQTPLTSISPTNYGIAVTLHILEKDTPLSRRPIWPKKSSWPASGGGVTVTLANTAGIRSPPWLRAQTVRKAFTSLGSEDPVAKTSHVTGK